MELLIVLFIVFMIFGSSSKKTKQAEQERQRRIREVRQAQAEQQQTVQDSAAQGTAKSGTSFFQGSIPVDIGPLRVYQSSGNSFQGQGSMAYAGPEEGECAPSHVHGGVQEAEVPPEKEFDFADGTTTPMQRLEARRREQGKRRSAAPQMDRPPVSNMETPLQHRLVSELAPAQETLQSLRVKTQAAGGSSLRFSQSEVVNGIVWSEILKRPRPGIPPRRR